MIFFKKQRGAITVFLALVLIPVMVFGCLTIDASKIYSAKVVVSDAGEMAMNAALAQYDEQLFDKYGLMAMAKTPSSIQGQLEGYFTESLNSTGVEGSGGYAKMLGLLENSFQAINVSNTEVYRTEIERQQILEYMKYRAPVCLTELVLKKIGFIKDSKKLLDAMNKQMDFAESMEDVQDAFDEALKALDALNKTIESFPDQKKMQQDFQSVKDALTGRMAKALLMRAAAYYYSSKSSIPEHATGDVDNMINQYIQHANKVNINDPAQTDSFHEYIVALYYDKGIDAAGGVNKVKGDSKAPDQKEDPDGYAKWVEENNKNSKLISDYNKAKDRISSYRTRLNAVANQIITECYNSLRSIYDASELGAKQAKLAYDRLEYVREKLKIAASDYNKWKNAAEAVPDNVQDVDTGSYKKQPDEYKEFFGGGKKDPMEALNYLEKSVSQDEDYFKQIRKVVEGQKLYDKTIAKDSPASQLSTYNSKAESAVASNFGLITYSDADRNIETIRNNSFVQNYIMANAEAGTYLIHIKDDPFYKQLQDYCERAEKGEKGETKDTKDANKKLEEGKKGAEDAKKDEGFPSFNWGSVSPLPSDKLNEAESKKASSTLTNIKTGDVSKKGQRRKSITSMKKSLNEATSFLDKVSEIVAKNAGNLYIAEYGMQMFSYYTCDKKMAADLEVKEVPEKDLISLSGFPLKNNKAYKAEVEYILWGNKSSQTNILSTMALLFGIRLFFNSICTFTDSQISPLLSSMASGICAGAPYLIPIVEVALKLGFAVAESAVDLSRLKGGYGVAIIKSTNADNFQCSPCGVHSDNRKGITFDYGEYLRVFLNVQMLVGKGPKVLARIADCIQSNTDTDITKDYTMIEVQADVGVRTTFMNKIAQWSSSDWAYGDSYNVNYKSILGY